MPDGDTSLNKALPGTFAAFSLAPRSAAILSAWAEQQGIPNVLAPLDLHLTTVYSREPVPAYNPNTPPGMLLLPDQFGLEMFGDALVLTVQADWLQENHAHAMQLGATHDFPYYRPHITLSYDAAGFDITFGAPTFALRLDEERVEDLRKSLRAMADIARLMAAIEKARGSQPRVPAGSSKGGQFAANGAGGGAGTGMASGINAPQLGMADGFNQATGNPYPMRVPRPSDPEHNSNPDDVAVWVKGHEPGSLTDGPRFERWTPPADWSRVEGQMPRLDADSPIRPVEGKSIGAGVIIREPDGRIWMVEPTNHYGGYRNTFPKGTAEAGLSLQANAIKEAYEESGLKVQITGVLGDYERTTSVARFYLAERTGGTPTGAGPESQAVKLVPLEAARELANVAIDHKILDDYSRIANAAVEKRAGWVSQAVAAILAKVMGGDGYNRWPAGSSKGGEFAPKGAGGGGGSKGKGGAAGGAGGAVAASGAFQPALMTGKNPDNSALIAANKAIVNYGALANKADIAGLAAIMPPDPKTQASGGNGYTKAKFAQWQAAMTHAIAQSNKPLQANTGTDQTPMKLSAMTQVGQKPGGSAAGAVFQDADGQKWLVKSYQSSDQARNEVLAANLYKAAGIDAPEMRLVDTEGAFHGGIGVASKWEDEKLSKFDPKNPAQVDKAQEGFAVDAWLANWDVVGLENDNLLSRPDGSLVRIDPGGALLYRAMGGLKGEAFGTNVGEWQSLRGVATKDSPANLKAAQAFAAITPAKMAASAERVTNLSDDKIRALVTKYGPGTDATKAELADKLIARKADIAEKAASIAPAKPIEAPAAIVKPTVQPDWLTEAEAPGSKFQPSNPPPDTPKYEGKTVNFYNAQSAKIDGALNKFDSMPLLYVPTSAAAYHSDNYTKYVNHYMATVAYAGASGKEMSVPSVLQHKNITSSVGNMNDLDKLVADGDASKIQAAVHHANYAYVAAKLVEQGKGDTMIGSISAKQALAETPDHDFFAMTGFSDLMGKDAAVSLLNVHAQMLAASLNVPLADLPSYNMAGSAKAGSGIKPSTREPKSAADDGLVNVGAIEGPTVAPQATMPAGEMPQGVKLPDYAASKLPENNTNAPTFNAQVDKLSSQAASGDVAAILNSTYGTNTYGKKLAALANNTLVAMGHPALVSPGMNTKSDPVKGTYQAAAGWGGPKSTGLTADALAQATPKIATPKVKAEPKAPVFRPNDVPHPVDFTNWSGSGKGLSSKSAVNDQNTKVAAQLYDAAKTGDIAKLKALTFQPIDAAGNPTGAPKPISEHPSQHIRDYQTILAENIHNQLNPPQPPRAMKVGEGFGDLAAKAKKLDYKEAASWSDKIGNRYSVIGHPGVADEKALGIGQHLYAGHGFAGGDKLYNDSLASFQKLTATERNAIKSYTGGGYAGMTSALVSGKAGPLTQAKIALDGLTKAAQPLPKGMILKRFHALDEAGVAKMKSSIGKAILGPAIISTSVKPDFHWSGNVMVKMVTGEGVKALYAGRNPKTYSGSAISQHADEMEMIMQPSTRYLVQNVRPAHALTAEEKANGFTGGGAKWIIDVVILPTD